ncbi:MULTISPECIES: deoxycytidylate deaminase [Jonquetella]|uniref:Deoxycytidylate deaminase n=1 Tax=Jonquetella anthropi DSM 22815 TaxID=885272 RepID=H0ULS5_9BACT|nr:MULTISPECIES: dCMP deaminase family protein [Jonquetella]EEX48131.1 cytidine and deoxycytidylate deaminase zinc-binding region [Jonquetella anthropi E3_33 E1]EHM13566.1 deoxycytidylate deaminase [Jonquetella anthropi DSM 22815]ERL24465.1 cytidine and deoxycytidylate deaminase zinc-binding region [Jonquetella sp. BV3C21]
MDWNRPDWDSYFMMLALVAATRSTCLRRRVGAVIVRHGQVISTGYNGAPRGTPHCSETGCLRAQLGIPSGQKHELCRGSHAEMNAIALAASQGVVTDDGELYCTHSPCVFCSKALINAGIRRVVYLQGYPDELGVQLREQAGVVTEQFPKEKYDHILSCLYFAEHELEGLRGQDKNGDKS